MNEETRLMSNLIWNSGVKLTHNELDELLQKFADQAIQAERERLVREIEKMEVYDDEPDNCRRIISEIKYLISNK